MKRILFLILMIYFSLSFACTAQNQAEKSLKIEWDLVENKLSEPYSHQAKFIIENQSEVDIQPGWKLYFNSVFFDLNAQLKSPDFEIKHLAGDFFVLTGSEAVGLIPVGEKLEIEYLSRNPHFKNSHAPDGLIFTLADGSIASNLRYQKHEMSVWDLEKYAAGSPLPVPTPAILFSQNESLKELSIEEIPPFVPTPHSWSRQGETIQVTQAGLAVVGDKVFAETATYLTKQIKAHYNPDVDRAEKPVQIRISRKEGFPSEGYFLEIRDRRVLILASDEKGAFYGVQSFLALQSADFWDGLSNQLTLPQISISDHPAYSYRGFFLDVGRNFMPKDEIFRLLDLMALYKLNTFHFHLANDEGWRLEVKALPELSEYASQRGFSDNETDFLWPFYSSGVEKGQSPGSGFYTQEEFREILLYAAERKIEVIPEIGFPAHSRAAIKAMEKRYERFSQLGEIEKAEEFRLIDPNDNSPYLSAQNFRDNTICVCRESVYNFFETVVSEIKAVYEDAGLSLKTFHTGGDEVPHGVWENSPLCEQFLKDNKSMTKAGLGDYFRSRIGYFLKRQGIQQAGWEEIGQKLEGGEVIPNPDFSDRSWQLYAWNAVAGWGGEDMAYRLANAGYPVVISSSANYYFDLSSSWDPRDRGHTWSGVTSLFNTWQTVPGKFHLSHDETVEGKPWDWEEAEQSFEKLTEKGKENILGIQGQIWTETVKSPEMLESYLLPRFLALTERAWVGDPDWSEASTTREKLEKRELEWNIFVNQVGQIEIPKLEKINGGYEISISPPGLQLREGMVYANTELPSLIIRFTTDGSEPTAESSLYSEPIPFSEKLRFKAFTKSGQGSHVSWLEN